MPDSTALFCFCFATTLLRYVHCSSQHCKKSLFQPLYIPSLIVNLEQTPLSYFRRKVYVQFQRHKKCPIKGVDDKKQITGAFDVTFKGKFYQFNLLTQENQATFCQHRNFLLHFLSVLLRTIGSTLKNPLNFSKRLLFLL